MSSPLPAKYIFELYRGDTRVWEHRFTDPPVAWAASTAYAVGDAVTFESLSYACITAHTSGPAFDAAKWAADPTALGPPIDITDWDFLAEYRVTTEDATVLATDACVITDGPGGILTRTLSTVESTKLTPGKVTWDLQATKADGTVQTYLYNDKLKIDPDVSR